MTIRADLARITNRTRRIAASPFWSGNGRSRRAGDPDPAHLALLRGHHRGSRSHSPDSNAVNPCLTASDSPAQAARLHLARRLPGPSPFLRPARSRRDQREWHQVKGLRETSALGAAQQPPGTATRSAAAVLNPARRSPGRSRTHTPHCEPAAADRGALRAERGTGRSARFSRCAKYVSQPRRFGRREAHHIGASRVVAVRACVCPRLMAGGNFARLPSLPTGIGVVHGCSKIVLTVI